MDGFRAVEAKAQQSGSRISQFQDVLSLSFLVMVGKESIYLAYIPRSHFIIEQHQERNPGFTHRLMPC